MALGDMADVFERAALESGRAILDIYDRGAEVRVKGDFTPVTEADEAAERIILDHLARALPDIPVVAEEEVAAGRIPDISGGRYILVDPLDGTREFIGRNGEFTVNIALIEAGIPVLGMVYAPVATRAYIGFADQAWRLAISEDFAVSQRMQIRTRPRSEHPCALVSRSHNTPATDAYLRDNHIAEHRSIGSSLKFCLLAEGGADIYPRFGRTMQWDTAAGDAVLRAAGGMTLTTDGEALSYTPAPIDGTAFANPDFIALGDPQKAGMNSGK